MTPESELKNNFPWIPFYMEFANELRQFKSDRSALIQFIRDDQMQSDHFKYLRDRDSNNYKCDLDDICPFTTIGTFNRGILGSTAKIETKQEIAKKFASFLGIKTPVPGSFDGIPTLDNQKSWFFGFAHDKHGNQGRQPDDIDNLWKIFDAAIEYADGQNNADSFTAAFDAALRVKNTGPRYLSIGLFWIRPASFLSFDQKSEKYISDNADGLSIGKNLSAEFNGERYLNLVQELKARFQENKFPVTSFPELALHAVNDDSQTAESTTESAKDTSDSNNTMPTKKLHRLNQILFGPPGTGKTYNTISLAVAIAMGQDWDVWKAKEQKEKRFNKFRALKESGQIQMVTFHQNYAYEDFIEGIKPVLGQGNLSYEMEDGVFKKLADAARKKPENNHVLIIDEINRGNISKIFGELITLIEDTKREGGAEGLELTLPYSKGKFSVPNNLYIIGTMNTADRSIALLDTALRRRFKFTEIMPDPDLLKDIEGISLPNLLKAINERITVRLDREHQIGHSFFMNVENIDGLKNTFQQNIIPLLQEYFFDDWERIMQVLNSNGFVHKSKLEFVTTKSDEKIIYEILDENSDKWKEPDRYKRIYNSAVTVSDDEGANQG